MKFWPIIQKAVKIMTTEELAAKIKDLYEIYKIMVKQSVLNKK